MRRFLFIMSALVLGALSWPAEAQIPFSPPHPVQVQAEPVKNPAEPAAAATTAPAVQSKVEPTACTSCAASPELNCEPKACGSGGWIAGASAYYLKPSFHDNTAFLTDTLPGVNDTRQATDFAWKYTISPKIWLGYALESGFGIRAQAFYFDQLSKQSTTTNPGNGVIIREAPGLPDPQLHNFPNFFSEQAGDELAFGSRLQIYTYDLEATKEVDAGNWAWLFSGGGRYLHSAQDYSGSLVNAGGGFFETVNFGHNISCAGPTAAVQGRWRLGGSSVAVFGAVRGSLLVGPSHQVFSSLGQTGNTDLNQNKQNDTLPVGELELGLEYGRNVNGAGLFVQAAVVDQTYFGLGSASQADGNLSLFGFRLTVGLGY
jgi:hypothetical protein